MKKFIITLFFLSGFVANSADQQEKVQLIFCKVAGDAKSKGSMYVDVLKLSRLADFESVVEIKKKWSFPRFRLGV